MLISCSVGSNNSKNDSNNCNNKSKNKNNLVAFVVVSVIMIITITIVTITIIAILIGNAILEQNYWMPFRGPYNEGYNILGLYNGVHLLRETTI